MDKTLEQCYETLGLRVDATKEEVRKAYKRLALECHPDKNPNTPSANSKFQELGYAYKRITADEKLEEINEDCSDFDYWLQVFFYCLIKEDFNHEYNNREHFCHNCAHAAEQDETFLASLYKKRERNQEEKTFTDEEMTHFVKFNSLKEQREFNKKIFCESKKPAKTEPKVHKPKMKSNKQLKAEQWKRKKEMSKIAKEIEIKKKEEEQKIEYVKECLKKKKEQENSKSYARDGTDIDQEEQHYNRQQHPTVHKGHPGKETSVTNTSKEKPKRKHKNKGRVKAESKEIINKKIEREHKTLHTLHPAPVTKPSVTNSTFTRRPSVSSKPVTHVSRSSKLTSQDATFPLACQSVVMEARPVKQPTPITLPQPPNIWKKRLESQHEILEIQPSNEEEELRQLEIALEMSKKQVEIDLQQKQISALQEEIRLMSLVQEKFSINERSLDDQITDASEPGTLLPSSKVKSEISTNVDICRTSCSSDDETNNITAAKLEKQYSKSLDGFKSVTSDSSKCNDQPNDMFDDSYDIERDHSNTSEICTGSSCSENCTSSISELHSFTHQEKSKSETRNFGSERQQNGRELKSCPYGKNCCLGKNCQYFHPQAKRSGLNAKQNLCTEVKQGPSQINKGAMDTKVLLDDNTEKELDKRPVNSQRRNLADKSRILENSSSEDWDEEINRNELCNAATFLQRATIDSQHCATANDMLQKGQYFCIDLEGGQQSLSQINEGSLKSKTLLDDKTENGFDKRPASTLQVDLANEKSLLPVSGESSSSFHGEVFRQGNQFCQAREMCNPGVTTRASAECNRLDHQGFGASRDEVRYAADVGVFNGHTREIDTVSHHELQAIKTGVRPRVSDMVNKACPESNVILVSNQYEEQPTQTKAQCTAGILNGGSFIRPGGFRNTSQMGAVNGTSQESNREYQQEWFTSAPDDEIKSKTGLSNGTHGNSMGDAPQNIPQQGFVTNEENVMPKYGGQCHQNVQHTLPGMNAGTADSTHCLPKQFQTNSGTKSTQGASLVQQGPLFCLPMTNFAMPGIFPGGAVMHQAGLYNVPQIPSMYVPPLNYPLAQTNGSSVISSQAGIKLPKTVTENNTSTSSQQGQECDGPSIINSVHMQETSEPGAKVTSTTSSTKQGSEFTAEKLSFLPNMYNLGFHGNSPNPSTGLSANLNGIPSLQQIPLMTLPLPLQFIPGFIPLTQQNLMSNSLINMPSLPGNIGTDNLQESSKLIQGQANNYNVKYQCPPPLMSSKESVDTVNGLYAMSLMALESNYHAMLQLQLKGAQHSNTSCTTEAQTSACTVKLTEEVLRAEVSPSVLAEESINGNNGPKCMKINEDIFKTSNVRKPSSIPKVLSYAERNQ